MFKKEKGTTSITGLVVFFIISAMIILISVVTFKEYKKVVAVEKTSFEVADLITFSSATVLSSSGGIYFHHVYLDMENTKRRDNENFETILIKPENLEKIDVKIDSALSGVGLSFVARKIETHSMTEANSATIWVQNEEEKLVWTKWLEQAKKERQAYVDWLKKNTGPNFKKVSPRPSSNS